jgi:hypothetical protein
MNPKLFMNRLSSRAQAEVKGVRPVFGERVDWELRSGLKAPVHPLGGLLFPATSREVVSGLTRIRNRTEDRV